MPQPPARVVHLGFVHDFDDFMTSVRIDRQANEAFAGSLKGTGKTLAIASGIASLTHGGPASEQDVGDLPNPRADNASYLLSLTTTGLRPLVLHFAPTVHGIGDNGVISWERARPVTWWPALINSRVTAVPIQPDAPVTMYRMMCRPNRRC